MIRGFDEIEEIAIQIKHLEIEIKTKTELLNGYKKRLLTLTKYNQLEDASKLASNILIHRSVLPTGMTAAQAKRL